VISAAPALSAPSRMPMPSSGSTTRCANSRVARPIGTFTKKIQCQLRLCVSTPPARRPIDAPAAATKL
jgi:hypothetical protein